MPEFSVVPAKLHHCGMILRRLRTAHHGAIVRHGLSAHQALHNKFRETRFPRAWLIDGSVAAVGGVAGSALSPVGELWLAATEEALRYPAAMIREARRQIEEAMTTRHQLIASILDGDVAAFRFAMFLGFEPLRHNEKWVRIVIGNANAAIVEYRKV